MTPWQRPLAVSGVFLGGACIDSLSPWWLMGIGLLLFVACGMPLILEKSPDDMLDYVPWWDTSASTLHREEE